MFHMPDDPDNLVFLQELLNENRKKGFPSDINSLVSWCRNHIGEGYAQRFCVYFGITESQE